MPLIRDDSHPCKVRTAEWDWGNVCHRDPLGVHRCVWPEGHWESNDAHPMDCQCACGTRRIAGLPKRRTGA